MENQDLLRPDFKCQDLMIHQGQIESLDLNDLSRLNKVSRLNDSSEPDVKSRLKDSWNLCKGSRLN